MKTKLNPAKNGRKIALPAARKGSSNRRASRMISAETLAASPFKIKSILVPVDFSDLSKKALDYAVPFARQFGAKLTLVHVVEPVTAPAFAAIAPLVMENDKVMAGCKTELLKLVKQKGIPPKLVEKTLVRMGRSFDEIADAARTLKVDVIIISTHGYTGLKHSFLGSTTERVVQYAPCPVLVVREQEHEFLTA